MSDACTSVCRLVYFPVTSSLFVCLSAYRSVVCLSVCSSVCLSVCLYVCSRKAKRLSSYLSPRVASPLILTCSLRKNSWPFNFLRTSFDTNSQPFTDWMHDKLLSSLPEESWSSPSVGTSVLDVKCIPGLPGGVTAGESESWKKHRKEHVTTLLHLWSIASHWLSNGLWHGPLSIPTSLNQCHAVQTIYVFHICLALKKQCQNIRAVTRCFFVAIVDDIKIKKIVSLFFSTLVYPPFIARLSLFLLFYMAWRLPLGVVKSR